MAGTAINAVPNARDSTALPAMIHSNVIAVTSASAMPAFVLVCIKSLMV
jgi:hypothetical protein